MECSRTHFFKPACPSTQDPAICIRLYSLCYLRLTLLAKSSASPCLLNFIVKFWITAGVKTQALWRALRKHAFHRQRQVCPIRAFQLGRQAQRCCGSKSLCACAGMGAAQARVLQRRHVPHAPLGTFWLILFSKAMSWVRSRASVWR